MHICISVGTERCESLALVTESQCDPKTIFKYSIFRTHHCYLPYEILVVLDLFMLVNIFFFYF